MTKVQKNIALTTTLIAIVAFSIWLYFDFSFEPAIGIIIGIGSLTAYEYVINSNESRIFLQASRPAGQLSSRKTSTT